MTVVNLRKHYPIVRRDNNLLSQQVVVLRKQGLVRRSLGLERKLATLVFKPKLGSLGLQLFLRGWKENLRDFSCPVSVVLFELEYPV